MLLVVTILLGAIAISSEMIYSKISGKRLYGAADTLTNLSAAAFEHVFAVLVAVPVYWIYVRVFEHRFFDRPLTWAALPLALVLTDAGFYAWHRLSHRVAILWFGHAVHHSSEEFNFSVAIRASGWARLTQRFFYLPLALVGIPVEIAVAADLLANVYALFLHNRTVPRLRSLEWLLVTPSHHRVHHARNPEYIDKNFGAMFTVWDRLFGTYQIETVEPVYGLTKPLATLNIGWARFHTLFELAAKMRRAPRLGDALLVPWMPPDFDPGAIASTRKNKVEPQVRLSIAATGALRIYALAQHVVLFVAVLGFTVAAPNLAWASRIFLGVWLCASLAVVGALMERRAWAPRAEIVRWLVALGFFAVLVIARRPP